MSPPLRFYIIRPDRVVQTPSGLMQVPKTLVPLIAVDELPDCLDVIGVPRQLTPEQSAQLTNLGAVDHLGAYNVEYVEESDIETDSSTLLASPDVEPVSMHGRLETAAAANGIEEHKSALTTTQASQAHPTMHPAERLKAAFPEDKSHANTSSTDQLAPHVDTPNPTTTTAPSSHPGAQQPTPTHHRLSTPFTAETASSEPPKKETMYCRHWVNKGTCKWGPLCRYAHTMPATAAGLQECGLTAFPLWWSDMMGMTRSSLARHPARHPGPPPGRRGQAQAQGLGREMGPALSHVPSPAQMAPYFQVGRGSAARMMVPGVEQMDWVPYERYGYGYGAGGRVRERKRREGKKEVHPVHGEGKKGKGKEIGGKAGLPGLARMEAGERRGSKGSVKGGEVGKEAVETPEKAENVDRRGQVEQVVVPQQVVHTEEKVEKLVDV